MILYPATDHEVHLLAPAAAFLPASATLILADLHLGKSATFRARGLAIPDGDDAHDLARIAAIVYQHSAREIIIAGDLFHAPAGITPELQSLLAHFLQEVAVPFHLVTGNHDQKIRQLPENISSHPSIDRGKFRIIHDPAHVVDSDNFYITGHWHPVVKIREGKTTSLRLPAFLQRRNFLVLPAFGTFTGGAMIPLEKNDRIFVAHRDQISEIPASLCLVK